MRNYLIPFVVCLLFVSCSNNKEIKDPNDFNIEVAKSFIDKNDMFGNNVTSFFQGYWISINQQKILIEDFFGIPIFISGPHKDNYLSSCMCNDFGHYNPLFLKQVISSYLMLSLNLKKSLKPFYDTHLKFPVRNLLLNKSKIYFEFFNPEFITSLDEDPNSKGYLDKIKNKIHHNDLVRKIKDYEDNVMFDKKESRIPAETLFWIRRLYDGTEDDFLKLFILIIDDFDADFKDQLDINFTNDYSLNNFEYNMGYNLLKKYSFLTDTTLRQKRERFYSTGELKSSANYIGNVKEGKETVFYKSGQLQLKVNFVRGRKHGDETSYHVSGEIKSVKLFDAFIESACVDVAWLQESNDLIEYYKSGELKRITEYNLFPGESQFDYEYVKTYYRSGGLKSTLKYHENFLQYGHPEFKEYNKFGDLKTKDFLSEFIGTKFTNGVDTIEFLKPTSSINSWNDIVSCNSLDLNETNGPFYVLPCDTCNTMNECNMCGYNAILIKPTNIYIYWDYQNDFFNEIQGISYYNDSLGNLKSMRHRNGYVGYYASEEISWLQLDSQISDIEKIRFSNNRIILRYKAKLSDERLKAFQELL